MFATAPHGRRFSLAGVSRLAGAALLIGALIALVQPGQRAPELRHDDATSVSAPSAPVNVELPANIGAISTGATQPGIPALITLPGTEPLTVVPVGLTDDNAMELPDNPATVGWYMPGGVRPGTAGTAVLAAHVDTRRYGLGPFVALHTIAIGTVLDITHDDGTVSHWQVTEQYTVAKADLAATDVFSRVGPPQLALITCGGRFDTRQRSYYSNIVVMASPYRPSAL